MPRKLTYEERMAKAQREKQAIDDRLKKLAEAQQKAREKRLLTIARATRLLDVDDEVLLPDLRQLVQTLITRQSTGQEGAHV